MVHRASLSYFLSKMNCHGKKLNCLGLLAFPRTCFLRFLDIIVIRMYIIHIPMVRSVFKYEDGRLNVSGKCSRK